MQRLRCLLVVICILALTLILGCSKKSEQTELEKTPITRDNSLARQDQKANVAFSVGNKKSYSHAKFSLMQVVLEGGPHKVSKVVFHLTYDNDGLKDPTVELPTDIKKDTTLKVNAIKEKMTVTITAIKESIQLDAGRLFSIRFDSKQTDGSAKKDVKLKSAQFFDSDGMEFSGVHVWLR